ncbi:ATP-dependent RecD-like DNA helicase [Vagococcus fluvialis]|uniref:SF1B family DNA helicase RecD2 n=1 Tax=Vagococcus fluvialis TaxID=2738 RepID=UPI001A8F55C7|nr:ATP-dependent RecD-like DNA helicase [Vagococcus fluvialis]MBO0437603.1 ATP-dependent RecD-like DNA helicase [Vagococcus fluvialis]
MFEEENEKNFITGQVVTTFYENTTNFYKVLLVNVKDTNTSYMAQEIVATGTFGQIQEDEVYRFYGDIVNHPKYGEQLKVDSYQQDKPTSQAGMIQYLSSDKFPGIGKKIAENIVDVLGPEAIDKIIENPECLTGIKGLTYKKIETLVETVKENYGMEQIIIGLNQYGFGNQLAFSIYQFYKEDTLTTINENPYKLVEDIEGVGFKKADGLAERIGIAADSPQRIRAALVHELFQSCLNTGDTYMEARQLLVVALETLEKSRPVEINPSSVAEEVIRLSEEGVIIQEGTRLYEKSLYFSEVGITTSIKRLLKRKKEISYPKKEIEKGIESIEDIFNIKYGASQQEAIREAITSPFFILTGGPGTGKTTVVNGIVTLFAELNGLSLNLEDYTQDVFPILLAAPTGRAAKRMNEMTGLPASTIHRLLGLTGREKEVLDEARELEGGLLIVDEMSMVDTWLANTLLKSIPNNMQVIFVGDKDQLPSVGPGQVLTDLLAVEEIPKRELTDIYRQEDGSTIISLAHSIKNGKLPSDLTTNQKDRSFIACSVNQIESVVEQVVLRAKNKGFSSQNVQVLAPMYRGKAGIDQLNQMMQEILNGNEDGTRKEAKWLDKVYRIGDKVLHLVNSPEFNVFNGDMGEITGITYAKDTDDKVDEMTLLFDETEVTYKRQEWNKFTLAYACSIHKSQGSEFQMVILPLVKQYGRMLQRKLIYTAVTRSKDFLILLGETEAFRLAIESEMIPRQTTLRHRLVEDELELKNQEHQMIAYEEEKTEAVKEELEKQPAVEVVKEVKATEQTISLFEEVEDTVEEEILNYQLTLDMVKFLKVNPMIGMKNVTPYDFMTN